MRTWYPKLIHGARLVEFDAIAMLEQDAFDYVHRTTSPLVIAKMMGMMGSTDLTEPNWAILGEYIEKPAYLLMRKSRRTRHVPLRPR